VTTPRLHLETLFVFDARGRIVGTREPNASRGPLLVIVRGTDACVWATRADLDDGVAIEVDTLARTEPPASDLNTPPVHARRYRELLAPRTRSDAPTEPNGLPVTRGFAPSAEEPAPSVGWAFAVPEAIGSADSSVVALDDERPLEHHFRGWTAGEVAARAPVFAILGDRGEPVSLCFGARLSDVAVEAGVETAAAYRGRGYAARVTTRWAAAIRASARTPLYSTSWTNTASLAVARKLGLVAYASSWSIG